MITVTIAGRLGRDAEVRQAGNSQVCSFSVAADTGFGDRKQSHWFNCSIWGNQGVALCQYLKKGGQVTITGEFSEREHDGKFYKELRVNQIELQGGKQDNQSNQQNQGNYQNNYQQPNNQQPNNQPPQNQFSNQQAQNYAQQAAARAPQPSYQNQGNFSAQPQGQAPQNPADIDSEIPF